MTDVRNQPDLIVLVSGKAGSGKTTFANNVSHLLSSVKNSSLIIPLSESLKEEAKKEHGWDGNKDEEGRALLQRLGEHRRSEDIDYWCKKLADKICGSYCDTAIVDDLRYKSEFDFFLRSFKNVVAVRLERYDGCKTYDNGLTKEQKMHISEVDLDDVFFQHRYSIDEGLSNNYDATVAFLQELNRQGTIDMRNGVYHEKKH